MKTKSLIVGSSLILAASASLFVWRQEAPAQTVVPLQPIAMRSPLAVTPEATPAAGLPNTAPAATDGANAALPEKRSIVGLVVPAAQAEVRAQADGVLGTWIKGIDQTVRAGETLVPLDDQDLKLETMRQAARIEAARNRIAAGHARLALLEKLGQKYAELEKKGAVNWAETAENRCLSEEATQNLHALEQDLSVAEIGGKSIERQMRKLHCTAPLSGVVSEVLRATDEYVREGEIIARIRSEKLQVVVNLPADQIPQLSASTFSLGEGPRSIALSVAGVKGSCNLDGSRSVTLNVSESGSLVVGQVLFVKVSAK